MDGETKALLCLLLLFAGIWIFVAFSLRGKDDEIPEWKLEIIKKWLEEQAVEEAAAVPEDTTPDVRNVRWGMTIDEVKANESASWTDEPNIVENNKDGGSTIIANVDIFGGNKALLMYEFEKDPIDTLKRALSSMEYKIFYISDADYKALILDFNMDHGKGDLIAGGTTWETEDRRTVIVAFRYDLIKSLLLVYADNHVARRQGFESAIESP